MLKNSLPVFSADSDRKWDLRLPHRIIRFLPSVLAVELGAGRSNCFVYWSAVASRQPILAGKQRYGVWLYQSGCSVPDCTEIIMPIGFPWILKFQDGNSGFAIVLGPPDSPHSSGQAFPALFQEYWRAVRALWMNQILVHRGNKVPWATKI